MRSRVQNILFYCAISLLIAGILSVVVSKVFGLSLWDVMFIIGIAIAVIGAMSSISGNATGSRLFGGAIDSQYQSFTNIETLEMERKLTAYLKNFTKKAVFDPKVSGIGIISSGLVLVLITLLISITDFHK